MFEPDPGGRLHQHARGVVGDLGDLPAHDPGDPARPLGVADQRHVGVEGPLDVVEGDHRLPRLRAPDHDAPAANLVQVEGVERLGSGQHHVVGDVDDVRDRALAGGRQALLEPDGRLPHLHALEHAPGEPQADVGVGDLDRYALSGPGLDVALGRVFGQGRAGQRVQVAGHAVYTQRVGAVGVDLELEDLVGDGQVVGQRGAGGPAGQLEDARRGPRRSPARPRPGSCRWTSPRGARPRRARCRRASLLPAAPPPPPGLRPRWGRRTRSSAAPASRPRPGTRSGGRRSGAGWPPAPGPRRSPPGHPPRRGRSARPRAQRS